MLSQADRSKAAEILLTAEKERKPALQLSKTFPDITIEDAYAIQSEVTRLKVAAGHRVRGHKVGLTSKAMQQSSQIDEPDYGHLMDYMFIADGAKIPFERFIVPRVEIELAFVLGKPLKGPGVELVDVLRATEYVVPAIEIIDARVQNPRKIFDTVSDNGAAAGHSHGRAPGGADGRGPALGQRAVVPQLGDRGNRRGCGRARPSGDGHRLARQQGGHLRHDARAGARGARRILHPPGVGGERGHPARRLRPARRDLGPVRLRQAAPFARQRGPVRPQPGLPSSRGRDRIVQ